MEKILALAEHLGLEYFKFQGDYYTGSSQIEIDEMSIDEAEKFCEDEAILLSDQLTVSNYDDNIIEYGSEEYLVVTNDEADDLWEADLDSYLEECIYPELSGDLANYFDDEKWKSDARIDGRAHSLSRYDGNEDSEIINDVTYFIYRQN